MALQRKGPPPPDNSGYRGAGEALLSPSSPEEELQEQELRGADPNARARPNQTLRPPASDAAARVPPSWGRCTLGARSPRLGPRRGEPHTQQDGEENPTRNPQPFGGHRKDAAEGAVGSSSVFSENGGAAKRVPGGESSAKSDGACAAVALILSERHATSEPLARGFC